MNKLFGIFTPTPLPEKSRACDLKARLDWGDPALTIIDARERNQSNLSQILGAIPIPMDELVDRALMNLELTRHIYIYGETDEETTMAAIKLREAGYQNVSELRGGVAAWKAVDYPIEPIAPFCLLP